MQILTGFLLTVPFTQRFPDLDGVQVAGYLTVLIGCVVATGFIIAPVAMHRTLFRQGEKEWLVDAANWCARTYPGLQFAVDATADRVVVRIAAPLDLPISPPGWDPRPMISATAASYVLVSD